MAGWELFLHSCYLPRKGEEFRQFATDILDDHSNYSRDQFGAESPYSGTGCNGPQHRDGVGGRGGRWSVPRPVLTANTFE